MATGALILWGHALAALLFGALAFGTPRGWGDALPKRTLATALALTALWALAVAGIGSRDVAASLGETARNVAWLTFLYALLRQTDRRISRAVVAVFAVLLLICAASAVLAVANAALGLGGLGPARAVLRMTVAVTALLLVHQLSLAAQSRGEGGLRLLLIGLAVMWSADLGFFATAWMSGAWPEGLVAVRGIAMAVAAVVLAIALHRGDEWTLKVSRALAYRSVALGAVALYVVVIAAALTLFGQGADRAGRIVQTAIVAGATATLIGVLASPWVRAWVKVKVAKHLFDHRYDYRHEWLRFTATLGSPDAGPLEERVVQAVANLTDSPGGLLLVADGDGLGVGSGWNWAGDAAGADDRLARYLEGNSRIVDLDALRRGGATEAAPVPAWLLAREDAWTMVPLVHLGRLAGVVVLARPPIERALDWEDFDLLRVAGRQGASYLAEHRAAAALGEARRFEEFNRRFAFIVHDVKNLVSQLTLVARNAERHADNPAFRADMIATLQDSCGRMSALLQRLSQHSGGRADPPRPTEIAAIARRLAERRRGQHPVTVAGPDAWALVDPVRFEQVLTHLIQNAIEASPDGAPVVLSIEPGIASVTIAVTDTGTGMTTGFVRDELFRPFASSKDGGFGIGAFEARQLAQGMAGSVAVDSAPGRGTRFAVTFPAAPALAEAA